MKTIHYTVAMDIDRDPTNPLSAFSWRFVYAHVLNDMFCYWVDNPNKATKFWNLNEARSMFETLEADGYDGMCIVAETREVEIIR